MSAIRIVNGEYRKNPVRNTAFTLVSGFTSGAKGNYVTVKNNGTFPDCPDTIRIRVNSIRDFDSQVETKLSHRFCDSLNKLRMLEEELILEHLVDISVRSQSI